MLGSFSKMEKFMNDNCNSILVVSILIIDGKNQFGQAYHQQNLDMSNIFRANYQGEKNQQKQKGH